MKQMKVDGRMACVARRLALAFAPALALMLGSAQAAGVPVIDGAHVIKTSLGWVQQYQQQIQQYAKQLQQYQTQIRQLEQQYVKGGAFRGAMMTTTEFQQRGLNDGVTERCPVGLRDLLSSSVIATKCVQIVQTENARYNAMLEVLKVSKSRNAELQEIYDERASIPEQNTGEMVANTNRLASFGEMLQLDMQRAQTQTEAYDKWLYVLKEDMKATTEGTLDGASGGIVGGVIRGAALKAALSSARRDDR